MTTPNGMLMGLGGSPLLDVSSQQGGTTYGDIFMLNIDDPPEDAAQELRKVAMSGVTWGENDNGTYRGQLDLDRLLHHEEIHSQQWARETPAIFVPRYIGERLTDGTQTEEGAGLSDGGYR